MKSEGVAGIIVPSSVLSNGKLYTKARKMLLENFDIIAISEFGSKTFGSTGTSTITLFLRKKKYPPNEADNYRYAVERWFTNTDIETDDVTILEKYCETIGVDYNSYCELQLDRLDSLLDFELFQEYITAFDKSKRAKDIKKKKISEKYSKENKEIEYKKALYNFIKEIEQEKVFYFALINSQKNDVIVVKSPTDKEQIKEFLGYEWSKRKGQEGIKYIGANITDEEMEVSKNQAINSINTPLFNPTNLEDTSKINTVIRNNFINSNVNIPKELKQFVSAISLVDMIDFTQSTFDAQIKTSADKKIEVVSKYPVQNLKMIADINKGQTITKSQTREGNIKVVAGGKEYAYTHNIANREANIITISASGANAGYVNYWDEPIFASDTITVQADTELETKYIFNFLRAYQEEIFNLSRGAAQPHVYVKDIEKFPIPVLPINIQEQIISEVEKLDIQYQNSRMKIEDYRKEIMNIFKKLDILCD